MKRIQKIVKNYRDSSKESITQFSKKTGLPYGLIRSLERGELKSIKIHQLNKILSKINLDKRNFNNLDGGDYVGNDDNISEWINILNELDYEEIENFPKKEVFSFILNFYYQLNQSEYNEFDFKIEDSLYKETLKLKINKKEDEISLFMIMNNIEVIRLDFSLDGDLYNHKDCSPELACYILKNLLLGYLLFRKNINQYPEDILEDFFKKIKGNQEFKKEEINNIEIYSNESMKDFLNAIKYPIAKKGLREKAEERKLEQFSKLKLNWDDLKIII